MVEPQWLPGVNPGPHFFVNFLTWEEQTGLSFDKMTHCMFSVAETLWLGAAD